MGTIVKIGDGRRYCRVSSHIGVNVDKFNQCRQRSYFFRVFLILREQFSIQFPDIIGVVQQYLYQPRSEERRVGKECRSRGSLEDEEKQAGRVVAAVRAGE